MNNPDINNDIEYISEYEILKRSSLGELKKIDNKHWVIEDYPYSHNLGDKTIFTSSGNILLCDFLRSTQEGKYRCDNEHIDAVKKYVAKGEKNIVRHVCWAEMALFIFTVNVSSHNGEEERVWIVGARRREGIGVERQTRYLVNKSINDSRKELNKPKIDLQSEFGRFMLDVVGEAYENITSIDELEDKVRNTIRKYKIAVERLGSQINIDTEPHTTFSHRILGTLLVHWEKKLKHDTSHIIASSLKDWLKKHPDSDTKIIVHGSKECSLNDVIKEIDEGSEMGNELIRAWIDLIIKMTLREKNE